jgi:hypothetical protein
MGVNIGRHLTYLPGCFLKWLRENFTELTVLVPGVMMTTFTQNKSLLDSDQLQDRIVRIGFSEFEEIRSILRQEALLLPPSISRRNNADNATKSGIEFLIQDTSAQHHEASPVKAHQHEWSKS